MYQLVTMKSILYAFLFLISFSAVGQTVSTVAGTAGVIGSSNGTGTTATFNNPHGIAIDPSGNVFLANRFGHTIRKITPAGVVTTFAGSGNPGATDGNGTLALFNEPWAVACDAVGNVYVADTKNYKIRKINSVGDVTTVAGTGIFGVTNGASSIAQFGFPTGIAVNNDGSKIYVCDRMTNTIRKIETGVVTTIAGTVFSPGAVDGPAATSKFDHPYSVALDASGNLFIADEFNNKIRKLSTAGIVSTFAGTGVMGGNDGPSAAATFNAPWGVTVDANGDVIVGDANNFTVRKISQGVVSVLAGQNGIPGMVNGPTLQSTFNGVSGIAFNTLDNSYYLCDPYSQLVRKIAPQMLSITTTTGAISFCVGSTVTLVASPTNLTNYIFKDGATILGTSSNGQLTVSSLSIGSHNITCTAINTQGITIPSNTFALEVTQGLVVDIIVQGSATICQGDSVTLSSSVVGTYQWSTGATTSSIQATTAGTYTLTVTNSQGCSGQSTPAVVQTLQPPAATIATASTQPICVGDSTYLTAGTATTYAWSNGTTTQTTYITQPGNYTVIVSNGAGCSAISQPVTVAFHTQSSSSTNPSGNILIAQGSSVIVSANAGTGYQWSTGEISQTISISNAGIYTVIVTDQSGCTSLPASVQVSYVSPSNMISVTGTTTFCDGDSVLLSSAFANNNQWYLNGAAITGAIQQNYYATQQGFYRVRYAPPLSTPVFSDSVEVTVRLLPNSISSTSNPVCKNQPSTLSVASQPGIAYNWYDTQTGGTSLATGLSYITPPIQQSKSYYVEVSNTYGCIRSQRFEVIATLLLQPDASFLNSVPAIAIDGFEVIFLSNYIGGSSYFWDFGDPSSTVNTSSDPNPRHIYTTPGDYITTLTVTNASGCVETSQKTVSIYLADNIFIPSGFTPNGDGNNDLFRVRGNNISYYDMNIFNQWGQRIWFSQKETIGWNGQSNGEYVPNGNYAYAIEVFFDNGNKTFYRGNISVIR
jgi:gliding motility-associated-like protein